MTRDCIPACKTPDCASLHPGYACSIRATCYELYAEDFRLVAEILSPSNTRREIELKLRRYREAPGNLYVVVIEPRRAFVEIRSRSRDWQPVILTAANELIEMPEFGLRCLVGDRYCGTPLNPQTARA